MVIKCWSCPAVTVITCCTVGSPLVITRVVSTPCFMFWQSCNVAETLWHINQSINQSNFYSANIPGEASLSGATAKSVFNSRNSVVLAETLASLRPNNSEPRNLCPPMGLPKYGLKSEVHYMYTWHMRPTWAVSFPRVVLILTWEVRLNFSIILSNRRSSNVLVSGV